MPEENSSQNPGIVPQSISAAADLVNAIPVYQDAVQPAAKEVGRALETVIKAVNVALAPLEGMIWGYDRIKAYLEVRLATKLQDIPLAQIATPDPAIVCPAIEALRFRANDENLRELFASLIANSMNAAIAHTSHPSFVNIISSLCPDEALILQRLSLSERLSNLYKEGIVVNFGSYTFVGFSGVEKSRFQIVSCNLESGDRIGLEYETQAPTYITNLQRLGLTFIVRDRPIYWAPPEGLHEHDESLTLAIRTTLNEGDKCFVALSPLGEQFCRACMPNKK